MTTIRVIYSIGGCKFAGGGIGTTSYHAVAGIYRQRLLQKLIVSSYQPTEIDEERIFPVFSNPRGLCRILGEKGANIAKDLLHDWLASRKIDHCDLFHGWAGMSLRSLRVAKKGGAITVLNRASAHILTQKELLEEEYGKWGVKIKPMIGWGVKRQLREYEETDFIFVPSDFAYQSFLNHGISEKKLVKIPFGVDLGKFKIQPACQPASPKLQRGERGRSSKFKVKEKDSKFKVLFVGQVGIRKGVLYLLQAWENLNLKDAELLLVGNIEKGFKKICRNYLSYDPFDNENITWTGFVDPGSFYEQADIFVFPSIEEGSALVTYEAMAMGLPQVTTFNSGSVIENGKEGFVVDIRDSEALAKEILLLYQDLDLRGEMAQRCLEKIKKYSWHNYGENVVDAYMKIRKQI